MRHSPDYRVCMSVCSTPKTLQPNDMPLAHSVTLLLSFQLFFFCSLHPIVYTGLGFSQSYLFNPPPSKSSNLTKPSLIAAQRQLCTSLSHACFPCLTHVQFLHSLHVPPVLFQTAIMCLGVAQHGAEFHSSNLHQVLAGAKIK